jgi:hypothetical protein
MQNKTHVGRPRRDVCLAIAVEVCSVLKSEFQRGAVSMHSSPATK